MIRGNKRVNLEQVVRQSGVIVEGHKSAISALVLSSGNTYIVSGSLDSTIRIWVYKSLMQVGVLKGHTSAVRTLAVTNDNEYIISGGDDKTIYVWGMKSRILVHTFLGHNRAVNLLGLTSSLIISASSDKSIRLWSLDLKNPEPAILLSNAAVLSFATTEQILYSATKDKLITTWEIHTLTKLDVFVSGESIIRSLKISPDHNYIIYSTETNVIVLDHAKKNHLVIPQGCLLLETTKDFFISENNSTLSLYSYSSPQVNKVYKEKCSYLSSMAFINIDYHIKSSMAVSDDCKCVVLGTGNGKIKLRNLKSGKIKAVDVHRSYISAAALSDDMSYLATGSYDKSIRVWNLKTSKRVWTFKEHNEKITAVYITRDNSYLYSACKDKTLRMWSLKTGCLLISLEFPQVVKSIALSRSNNFFLLEFKNHCTKLFNKYCLL